MAEAFCADPSGLERLHQALLEYLRDQVDGFASSPGSAERRLSEVRRMCALIGAGRASLKGQLKLLARLRAMQVVLPVPGGCAEFSFGFWRDLDTIASAGWERHNLRVLRRVLRKGCHVVDVGAHVGHFAIYAAHLVGPSGRVLAAEPAPSNFEALRRNLARNGIEAFAQPVQVALSDTEGTAELFDDGETAGTEFSLYPNRHGSRGVSCHATLTTLDTLVRDQNLGPIDFVKIDTEGAELAVLRGARETLRRDGVSVLVELHPWIVSPADVCTLLEDAGYRLYDVRDRLIPFSVTDARIDATRLANVFATRASLSE